MGALLQQFMNKYPYTDFHELNTDWLIKTLMEMINQVENFVSLNAIKYADPIQWDIVRQYEKNTVVIDPLTGTAYISVQPVPSGVALTRTEYWTVVFDLGSFVTRAAKNFSNRYEADTTLTATFPTTAGNWLVWGDTLYEALANITAGDQYVVNSNIKHITMEEVVNALAQAINDVDAKVGDLSDLTTSDTTSIVNAINSVLNDLNLKVGDLSNLITSDTSSIVNAINSEVNDRTNADDAIVERLDNALLYNVRNYGAVGNGVADDSNAVNDALAEALTHHGILYFPAGTYLMNPINLSDRVSIRGEGSHQSILVPNTTTGDFITSSGVGNSIEELQIRCDTEPTSGFMIVLNGSNSLVQNVSMYYPYSGIFMNANTCRLENVYIRESVNYPIRTGIRVEGGDSSQIISDCILISMFDSTNNYGIVVTNNAALAISNTAVIAFQTNLRISDEVNAVYSLKVNNCYFDQGRYANIQIGSHCHRIAIYDSWIGDALRYGVDMQGVTDSELDLYNCDIVLNDDSGINVSGNGKCFINGCLIAGNVTGVLIQSSSNEVIMIANTFHGDDHGANQYGIYAHNDSETIVLIANDLTQQTVTPIGALNQALGTKIIKANAGYNAIGDSYFDNSANTEKYWNGSNWIIPTGYTRYNTDHLEFWNGTSWVTIP